VGLKIETNGTDTSVGANVARGIVAGIVA